MRKSRLFKLKQFDKSIYIAVGNRPHLIYKVRRALIVNSDSLTACAVCRVHGSGVVVNKYHILNICEESLRGIPIDLGV